ncbi:hypothetical protein [Bacillus pinisoli]|uniref:hypothetical protein n=1 Tax=Bacillus pinisoli TaxID=2901866 RepID=UPI001FF27752|nr:hypothetical protein [Bacillus pinisoli]
MKRTKVYQAQVGDGVREKSVKRTNSFFNTIEEAVLEAMALKEKMDATYKNNIDWDYTKEITRTANKVKILKGYHAGGETKPFYLQIKAVECQDSYSIVIPKKPKKMTVQDEKVLSTVMKLSI